MDQFDREIEQLDEEFASGRITSAEYTQEMRDMQRDYREQAERSAEDAYHDEMARW